MKANREYIFILYLQLKTVANRRRKKYNIINKGVQMGQKEGAELKAYQVRQLCDLLEQEGLI
mgnify:FL=1